MKIVLVLAAALVVFAAASVSSQRRKLRQSARALGLDAPGVRVIDCGALALRFALKPSEGKVYVIRDVNASPICIPLEDVSGCEFLDYGERKRSLGRALAGEAVADYVGGNSPLAVLRILRRDPASDAVEYRLTKSMYYDDFCIFAAEVEKLLAEYLEQAGTGLDDSFRKEKNE